MEQQQAISIEEMREIVDRIKNDLSVPTLRVGAEALRFLISYGEAAGWMTQALAKPLDRLLGIDVVLDPKMDPRAWRFVATSGEVHAEGTIPVTLEDGQRIGAARVDDDGRVVLYITDEQIARGISGPITNLSIDPFEAEDWSFRRDVQRMAEEAILRRPSKPITITGI